MKFVSTSSKSDKGVMMCSYEKSRDAGVSPVVGVMLMLVVTIIIAAVVSAFAGGIGANAKEPPKIVMNMLIKNSGESDSYYSFDVVSVSKPIPTSDLKIVTSWKSANGTRGGSTVSATLNAPNTVTDNTAIAKQYQSPLGFGPSIELQVLTYQTGASPYDPGQMFGNYTLMTGTNMKNFATSYGGTNGKFSYPTVATFKNDGIQAVFGKNWNILREGDKVNVKVIYVPSGQTLVDKDVIVEG